MSGADTKVALDAQRNGAAPARGVDELAATREDVLIYDPDQDADVRALAYARHRLGLPKLVRVLQRGVGAGSAIYELGLEDGTSIEIGDMAALANPRKVEVAVAHAVGKLPPHYGPQKFRPIANALLALAEVVDDSTRDDVTRDRLASYIAKMQGPTPRRSTRVDLDDPEARAAVAGGSETFYDTDGRFYLQLQDFGQYLVRWLGVPATAAGRLRTDLGRLGFERHRIRAPHTSRDQGTRRAAWYWRSPPGFDPVNDGRPGGEDET